MKLLRMTMEDFRGVDERTIEFASDTTVIVGPNEVGKSSISEALTLMLEEKATGNNDSTRAIRPSHTGANPRVEIEVESGPYRMVYAKTWGGGRNASSITSLSVTGPDGTRPYTGDDAHDKFLETLGEHSDIDLLSALTVHQTRSVTQAKLGNSGTLNRALADLLDDAAGTVGDDATLIGRVQEASRKWLTPTGKANKALEALEAETAKAEALDEEVARALAAAQDDVETHDRLARDILVNEKRLPDLEKAATDAVTAQAALSGLVKAVEDAQELAKRADEAADGARTARDTRRELTERVDTLTESLSVLEERAAHDAPVLEQLSNDREEAHIAMKAAREERATTRDRATEVSARHTRRVNLDRLDTLRGRVTDAQAMLQRRAEAQGVLDGHCPTPDDLETARQLRSNLAAAENVLAVGVPKLTVTADEDRQVLLDGTDTALHGDEPLEVLAEQPRTLVVDNVIVLVTPGQGAAELADRVDRQSNELAEHLRRHQAGTVEELAKRVEAVTGARQALAATDDDHQRLLDGGGLDNLRSEVDRLEALLPDTAAELDYEDSTSLEQAAKEAAEEAKEADTAVQRAENDLEAANAAMSDATEAGAKLAGDISGARATLTEVKGNVTRARAQRTDEQIEAAVAAAEEESQRRGKTLATAEKELAAAEPERAEELVTTTAATLRNVRNDLQADRDQRSQLEAKLKLTAADGLAERAANAAADAESLRARLDRAELEAAAIDRLLDTLTRHRDAARERYHRPLKDKVIELGRLVYGPTFTIELDEDLQIHQRTHKGVTVPFRDLSGGTREQLAVLMRVAAAMLVDPKDGVPVILDDVLGFSDPERLELFNGLIGKVAGHAQVIALTCWPDRLIAVPGQTRIKLT